ncbi:Protein RMD5 homolog, partial [Linum perenne]
WLLRLVVLFQSQKLVGIGLGVVQYCWPVGYHDECQSFSSINDSGDHSPKHGPFWAAGCIFEYLKIDLSLTRESFDQVAKKRKYFSSKSQELIDLVSLEIESALEHIRSVDNPQDQKAILRQLKQKLNTLSPLTQSEGPQKELNMTLAKYQKLLEKSLNPDISRAYRNVEFDSHIVNQVIATHFYRQGLFDLGDCLISESGEPEATSLKPLFTELQKICDAIRVRNLEPVLTWVSNNIEKLWQCGSKLDLKLHSSRFMEILKGGTRADTLHALNYAKTHLSPLAGCYKDPFCVDVTAGIEGLPTLLKLANVMSAKQHEWQALKQLAVLVEPSKDNGDGINNKLHLCTRLPDMMHLLICFDTMIRIVGFGPNLTMIFLYCNFSYNLNIIE